MTPPYSRGRTVALASTDVESDWPATLALMSYVVSLVASIDRRLDELTEEIAQLTRERTALEAAAANGASAPNATEVSPPSPDDKQADRVPAQPRNGNSAGRQVRSGKNGARRSGSPTARPTRRGTAPLRQEELERILGEAESGLSASTIAGQAGAGYQATLTLLRELEAKGAVRREGSRRSTRWRLLTDEDWIAERTAELERLAASRS